MIDGGTLDVSVTIPADERLGNLHLAVSTGSLLCINCSCLLPGDPESLLDVVSLPADIEAELLYVDPEGESAGRVRQTSRLAHEEPRAYTASVRIHGDCPAALEVTGSPGYVALFTPYGAGSVRCLYAQELAAGDGRRWTVLASRTYRSASTAQLAGPLVQTLRVEEANVSTLGGESTLTVRATAAFRRFGDP